LEDAAESLGFTYFGMHCGSLGKIAALLFNGNKIIATCGGGALLTPEKEIADSTLNLRTQARDNAPHYVHPKIGYNYRISNICAGIVSSPKSSTVLIKRNRLILLRRSLFITSFFRWSI
jgi:dTDP-4-amino-4,6-dideoxygalactose transaminase